MSGGNTCMNDCATHLLHCGPGADMIVSSTTSLQHPENFSERDIIIAGGFPEIHPDSAYPLSPTLQLNGDMTNCSATKLSAIGRAEFLRSSSQSFNSYVLDPDPGVTVVSADAHSLHAFIHRYSGVLDIQPLLLNAFDPDLTTAADLEILNSKDGCQLTYLVRQPVDLEECTYCGLCGPVCPQLCLSERLYLDFAQCTLCNECASICPHQVIDLHAVEKRELLTPAVLLLEGTRLELPPAIDRIYPEKELGRFFTSIYAAEVDEIISCNQTICQFSRKLGSGCDNCLAACKHGAISQDQNGVRIDHLKCTECGACLASCPTGALQYARFNDKIFIEYFRSVSINQNDTVVLGSEQELRRFWWQTAKTKRDNLFFLEYPRPGALSSFHFFLLYAMGAGKIIVLDQNNSTHSPLYLQVHLVNAVLDALFQLDKPVRFSDCASLLNEIEQPAENNPLPALFHDFSFSNRRQKLAALLNFLLVHSDAEALRLTGTAAADFGAVLCDRDKCTLCCACVGECSIAALSADSFDFSLNQLPALCVQCGTCVELCPEDALTLQPGLSLHPDFFTGKSLARAQPVTCLECGKTFGTQQSLTKIMAVLSAKNLLDKDENFLRYCETCRVVKLFESQG